MRFLFSILVTIVCLTSSAHAYEGSIKWRTVSGMASQLASLGYKEGDASSLFTISTDKIANAPGVSKSEFTLMVKGSKVKEIASTTGASYVIVDSDTGEIWMIAPSQKRYMAWTQTDRDLLQKRLTDMEKREEERISKLSGEEREKAQKMLDETRSSATAKPEFKALGQKEKIAGLDTEVYDVTVATRKARAWAAKEPADLAKAFRGVYLARGKMQGGAGLQQRDFKEVVSEKGVPARVISLQGPTFKVDEIVAVKEEPVPAEVMALPPDYQKVSLQDFLKSALQERLGKMGAPGAGAAPGAPAAPAAPPPAAPAPK